MVNFLLLSAPSAHTLEFDSRDFLIKYRLCSWSSLPLEGPVLSVV
jgi:hypothetical protein